MKIAGCQEKTENNGTSKAFLVDNLDQIRRIHRLRPLLKSRYNQYRYTEYKFAGRRRTRKTAFHLHLSDNTEILPNNLLFFKRIISRQSDS